MLKIKEIIYIYVYMDNAEEEIKKKVSQEFVINVKKYLEVDDMINEIKSKMKLLNDEKKSTSE